MPTKTVALLLAPLFALCLLYTPTAVQAQALKLSPMVHSPPPGGYNFQALVPLPQAEAKSGASAGDADIQNASYQGNGEPPVTTLDLKKK